MTNTALSSPRAPKRTRRRGLALVTAVAMTLGLAVPLSLDIAVAAPAQAAVDLQAHLLQPIHWARFASSDHAWNEPIKKLVPAAKILGIGLNVPLIGEPYTLGDPPKNVVWWNFD